MEDRISDLSDELLCHILAFLSTKLAITTSVLSKRWNPLWKSVLILYFNDKSFKDFVSFRYFMHSVFLLRDVTLPLRSLRIKCRKSINFEPRDINRFVDAAVQRGLEDFDINVFDENDDLHDTTKETVPGLLRVLSRCSTLVVLMLKNLTIYNVPHLLHLPLLQTLDLDDIDFMGPFEHFMNLVCGCPILMDFHTCYVTVGHLRIDSKSEFKGFPELLTAHICYSQQNFPFAWLYNAKYLSVYLTSSYEYPVPTFHNLIDMELIFEPHLWPEKWEWVVQVLQHCPKLQNLTLDEDNGDILPTGDIDWTEPETIPECISSQLRKCSLRGFDGIECVLHFAEYILLNSKLLCTMTVSSNSRLDVNKKHQMLVTLSSYPRGSVTCKLLFD